MDILVPAPVMPGGDHLAVVLPVKSGRPKVNQAHLMFIQFSFFYAYFKEKSKSFKMSINLFMSNKKNWRYFDFIVEKFVDFHTFHEKMEHNYPPSQTSVLKFILTLKLKKNSLKWA